MVKFIIFPSCFYINAIIILKKLSNKYFQFKKKLSNLLFNNITLKYLFIINYLVLLVGKINIYSFYFIKTIKYNYVLILYIFTS
jgi:hypothetical protein